MSLPIFTYAVMMLLIIAIFFPPSASATNMLLKRNKHSNPGPNRARRNDNNQNDRANDMAFDVSVPLMNHNNQIDDGQAVVHENAQYHNTLYQPLALMNQKQNDIGLDTNAHVGNQNNQNDMALEINAPLMNHNNQNDDAPTLWQAIEDFKKKHPLKYHTGGLSTLTGLGICIYTLDQCDPSFLPESGEIMPMPADCLTFDGQVIRYTGVGLLSLGMLVTFLNRYEYVDKAVEPLTADFERKHPRVFWSGELSYIPLLGLIMYLYSKCDALFIPEEGENMLSTNCQVTTFTAIGLFLWFMIVKLWIRKWIKEEKKRLNRIF